MQTTVAIDFGSLLDLYQSEEVRSVVSHNVGVLKSVRGGLQMSEQHRIAFNPRPQYWRLPERRLAVAYFADRWTARFAPASALRVVARRVLAHFDQARIDGVVSYYGIDYEQAGGFRKMCSALADHARRLTPIPEWEQLRQVWPSVADTAGEDLASFLVAATNIDECERGFKRRLPWFGYLDALSDQDLRNRQAFFFGYANLWTTTNAYVLAGALQFAPIIQNTPSDLMLDAAIKWATGVGPIKNGFRALGKDDDDQDPVDRSHFATVIEVYGFLNLERAPFYNNRAEVYRQWFEIPGDVNPYDLTRMVGKFTAEWLKENENATERLRNLLRKLIDQPWSTRVELETVALPKAKKKVLGDELLDVQLFSELDSSAKAALTKLDNRDAASLMLHLLLDSKVFLASNERQSGVPPQVQERITLPSSQEVHQLVGTSLPIALRPYGERALAYLKAGFHVLFAGAPGTGKTTLAQFVGYAWDKGLDLLPEQMPAGAAPLTTVGNSAWSPFHTIGGLMPTEKGTFTTHAGIFIDPASIGAETWLLRNGAVVLDEMNRADLDRCIGELYPLLSGSVERVWPAGLPGVTSIEGSTRFRVLATVNDAHLDDIVFPISEGLARRFQRLELLGGSRDDVEAFLGLDTPVTEQNARQAATHQAVEAFFEVAREHKLLLKAEDDDRLPFGVAYFTLLRSWLAGKLDAPLIQGTEPEQARDLLAGCLNTLGRTRKWNEALRTFLTKT